MDGAAQRPSCDRWYFTVFCTHLPESMPVSPNCSPHCCFSSENVYGEMGVSQSISLLLLKQQRIKKLPVFSFNSSHGLSSCPSYMYSSLPVPL